MNQLVEPLLRVDEVRSMQHLAENILEEGGIHGVVIEEDDENSRDSYLDSKNIN